MTDFAQEKYAANKERYNTQIQHLDKENRKARKDHWRLQSRIVEEQEKSLSVNTILEATNQELAMEKERCAIKEQEAFAARYELVGTKEELAQLQQQIKVVEQERDALKTIAKAEEIARIAAEGQIPLPVSALDDEFASPRKPSQSLKMRDTITSRNEEVHNEFDSLMLMLSWERQRADRALDQVSFLDAEHRLIRADINKLVNKSQGSDNTLVPSVEANLSVASQSSTLFGTYSVPLRTIFKAEDEAFKEQARPSFEVTENENIQVEPLDEHEQRSYARTPSCEPPALACFHEPNTSLLSLLDEPETSHDDENACQYDKTPAAHIKAEDEHMVVHTISTTTRVPLRSDGEDDDAPSTSACPAEPAMISPTVSREEALAMIRERRGRARSLAQGTMTPRKQMVDNGTKRDISAPALTSEKMRGRSQVRTL